MALMGFRPQVIISTGSFNVFREFEFIPGILFFRDMNLAKDMDKYLYPLFYIECLKSSMP